MALLTAFDSPYQSRPDASASEIRSTPRLSSRDLTSYSWMRCTAVGCSGLDRLRRHHLRSPISIRGTLRTGKHDRVAVGIPQPDLPMIRPTITPGRIAMAWQNDLGL